MAKPKSKVSQPARQADNGKTKAIAPRKRPAAAAVLSIIGGLIILFFGLASYSAIPIVGSVLNNNTAMNAHLTHNTTINATVKNAVVSFFAVSSLVGIITGVLVVVFGALMFLKPGNIKLFGVLVLIFSIVSIGNTGGFLIGMVLGIIGGILAIRFKE